MITIEKEMTFPTPFQGVIPFCGLNRSKDVTLQNLANFVPFFFHRSFFLTGRSIHHPRNQLNMALSCEEMW